MRYVVLYYEYGLVAAIYGPYEKQIEAQAVADKCSKKRGGLGSVKPMIRRNPYE